MKSNAILHRARLLPMPQPGILITVPLALLPAYLEMHGMESKRYDPYKRVLIIERKGNRNENKSDSENLSLPAL